MWFVFLSCSCCCCRFDAIFDFEDSSSISILEIFQNASS